MKQLVWGVFFCALMLFAAGCERDGTWQRDGQSGAYAYPLTASSPEWDSFSHAEKVEACAIPERVLADVNDEELVELVLKYPLLSDLYFFGNDFQESLEHIAGHCRALRLVLERDLFPDYFRTHMDESGRLAMRYGETADQKLAQAFAEKYMEEFGVRP